jgi:hypothetical protein
VVPGRVGGQPVPEAPDGPRAAATPVTSLWAWLAVTEAVVFVALAALVADEVWRAHR